MFIVLLTIWEVKNHKASSPKLALSIGDFIRYWGFRRVHGAIWTQLYLSPVPLSGTELATRLDFSKALISPALGELAEYELIHQVDSGDAKTLLYTAEADVGTVIQNVLKTREARMLAEIEGHLKRLRKAKAPSESVDLARLEQLGSMIEGAQFMLKLMLNEDDILNLPNRLEGES